MNRNFFSTSIFLVVTTRSKLIVFSHLDANAVMMMTDRILYIEPFYGGSHQQLVDLLQRELGGVVMSLPATKWHWRMRVSALHFALNIPRDHSYK